MNKARLRRVTLAYILPAFFPAVTLFIVATCPAAERPNIVFIIADDLGWADVAFHGGNTPTPYLDDLANNGLELTQHYVAPVCSPTRAGFLTGRCWSRFGVTTPTNELGLPPDTVTLPRALKTKGYETLLAGKWHLGSLPKWGPNHFGFDHSYGSLAGGISPWNHRYKKGRYSITWHRNHEFVEEPGHVTDLLTSEVVTWIKSRRTRPFFAYVPFTAVHLPIKEPREWIDRVPKSIRGDVARHYAACVMHLDDAVGQIIGALEESGVRQNTLVVLTSDNGGSTAENNDLKYPDDDCPNGQLPGNNKPLRAGKGAIYEGGTRVPTVVSWPSRAKPGRVGIPIQITDWMPTLCSLAGYESNLDLKWDGRDITRALTHHAPIANRPIYTVGPRWRSVSLRYDDWKLIAHQADGERRLELYNIAEDPSETKDVAKLNPSMTAGLTVRLEKMARGDQRSDGAGAAR